VVCGALAAMGIRRLIEAGSARAAIATLDSERPELVCMDLMLPDLSGYELCEGIRARGELERVAVLVVTAIPSITIADASASRLDSQAVDAAGVL
jgi:DNA-binding response OmpR family regulator